MSKKVNFLDIIFFFTLSPDSNPMTHETWQNSQASMVTVEIRIKTFIVKNPYMGCFFVCVLYSGTLVPKRVPEVTEYGSRFLSTGPLLGIYLGPGSQVQVPY